jgi:alkylation response protein AidB-like acyl-CoA dehydrogenase
MREASHPSEGPARLALPLTPAERSLVTIASRFGNEMIAPIAESLEREKSALPASVVAEWIRLGPNGMQVSTERGGAGASFFAKVAVAEAIARACFSVRFRADQHAGRRLPN